jgi:hypothetical protein
MGERHVLLGNACLNHFGEWPSGSWKHWIPPRSSKTYACRLETDSSI